MSLPRSVIIFKSESDSTAAYVELLQRHSFNVIFVPTLSFYFKNLDELCLKLQQPNHYVGIIFTSPRSVESAYKALKYNASLPIEWKTLNNYAVGEFTHNLANKDLQLLTQGKQTGNAYNLAEYIIETFNGSKELPFLLPCGNLKEDSLNIKLNGCGFRIDACEVYETKCNSKLAQYIEQALQISHIEYMIFFSPSCVNYVIEYFQSNNKSLDEYKLVAIGPSTCRFLEKNNLKVYGTAERPTPEHLINVLMNSSNSRKFL